MKPHSVLLIVLRAYGRSHDCDVVNLIDKQQLSASVGFAPNVFCRGARLTARLW